MSSGSVDGLSWNDFCAVEILAKDIFLRNPEMDPITAMEKALQFMRLFVVWKNENPTCRAILIENGSTVTLTPGTPVNGPSPLIAPLIVGPMPAGIQKFVQDFVKGISTPFDDLIPGAEVKTETKTTTTTTKISKGATK